MEKQRYITIQEWMLELGIKGSELLAFALVWGFSQDGVSVYKGGSSYASYWLGITKENARGVLNRLAEKGLLEKIDIYENGVRFCNYRANKGTTPKTRVTPTLEIVDTPTPKTRDNNNIDRNNKDRNYSKSAFSFLNSLLSIGVSEQTAMDWVAVRKQAKAVDTATAFNRIAEEIRKTGASAEDCIRLAVERNWRGFEAEWYANARKTQITAQQDTESQRRAEASALARKAEQQAKLERWKAEHPNYKSSTLGR